MHVRQGELVGWTCERSRDNVAAAPRFFVRAIRDAHADVDGEPITWATAVLFVVMNWRWLCRQEDAGWPTPEG